MNPGAMENQPNRLCVGLNDQEPEQLRRLAPGYCAVSVNAVVRTWLYERLHGERGKVEGGRQ